MSQDIVIERVPLPDRISTKDLPIRDLEAGESFQLPRSDEKYVNRVRQKASRISAINGATYSVLKQDDNTYRFYRTA